MKFAYQVWRRLLSQLDEKVAINTSPTRKRVILFWPTTRLRVGLVFSSDLYCHKNRSLNRQKVCRFVVTTYCCVVGYDRY